MNSTITRHIYYPVSQRFKGHKVNDYLHQLILNETLTKDELKVLQNRKLSETLKIAAETTLFYREYFQEHGFDWSDISHFSSLPTTSKDNVMNNPSAFHNTDCTKGICYGRTSGTTGIALEIRYDTQWDQWNQACQLRGRSWYGIYPGTRELAIWGRTFDNPDKEWIDRLKLWMLNKKQINCFQLSDDNLDKLVPEIAKFVPEIIYSYSTGVGRLAEYLIDRYGDDVPIKPRAIIITSETLMPQHKYAIKKAFGIEPINEYGAAEGGIIAFECPEGGLHLSADRVLTEIVNADEEGFGRVVITPFLNRAMPLIRYDIGDIGRIVDDECPCGRTLPLLELKGSRVSDMIKTPRGSFVSSTFFDFVAKSLIPFGLRQFKVLQKSPVNLQIIMLKSDKDKSRIETIVKREIKSFLGDDMQASFEYVDDIEPDKSGKLRYFVREDF